LKIQSTAASLADIQKKKMYNFSVRVYISRKSWNNNGN